MCWNITRENYEVTQLTIFAAFKCVLFKISTELGILKKSNREGICADVSELMHENAVEVLKISNSGDMKLAIIKSIEPLPQKTSPLHYALQTSVIRNKRYHFPTITNNRTRCNKDCKIMPIVRSNKMLQILSLWRSQEERLENYHALKPGCNNRNKHG